MMTVDDDPPAAISAGPSLTYLCDVIRVSYGLNSCDEKRRKPSGRWESDSTESLSIILFFFGELLMTPDGIEAVMIYCCKGGRSNASYIPLTFYLYHISNRIERKRERMLLEVDEVSRARNVTRPLTGRSKIFFTHTPNPNCFVLKNFVSLFFSGIHRNFFPSCPTLLPFDC